MLSVIAESPDSDEQERALGNLENRVLLEQKVALEQKKSIVANSQQEEALGVYLASFIQYIPLPSGS
jgi:hypothetical protein